MEEVISKVLVVKVGTNTMLKNEHGREVLDQEAFQRIGKQILTFREKGYNPVIFSSGAVTAGMQETGTAERPSRKKDMTEIQRLASVGWRLVLNAWDEALVGATTGGILISKRRLALDAPEHDEVLRTTHTLLSHGDVPILNEDDTATHSELEYDSSAQNDVLSAIFATQVGRSPHFESPTRLVMLSDVDGVLENVNDPSSVIKGISDISRYEHLAGDTNGKHGSGGMKTKFEAAKIATENGVEMWIANGLVDNAIQLALDGQIGTHFTLLEAV